MLQYKEELNHEQVLFIFPCLNFVYHRYYYRMKFFNLFRSKNTIVKEHDVIVVDSLDGLDGCELDFEAYAIGDKETLHIVLFADILGDEPAIKQRKKEYRKLFK